MKFLDISNEKERQRALKYDPPQPFYKRFIDSEKACPYCGEFLRRNFEARWGEKDNECECSYWEADMTTSVMRWVRIEKTEKEVS